MEEQAQRQEISWVDLPERMRPILRVRDSLGEFGVLALFGIFLLVPLLVVFLIIRSEGIRNFPVVLGLILLVWCGFFAVNIIRTLRFLYQRLQARTVYLRSQSTTIAHILSRKIQEHEGKYGTSYSYHLQLEFIPMFAGSTSGATRIQASISHRLYQSLEGRDSVSITYAAENPLILIIEGE